MLATATSPATQIGNLQEVREFSAHNHSSDGLLVKMNNTMNLNWWLVLGPIAATLFGLAAVLVLGCASWPLVRGVPGIAIGLLVATLFASLARVRFHWPISIVASGVGATVACYFAIATAELIPPGSIQWMWQGGLYGAMFGVPTAAIFSPLILLGRPRANE